HTALHPFPTRRSSDLHERRKKLKLPWRGITPRGGLRPELGAGLTFVLSVGVHGQHDLIRRRIIVVRSTAAVVEREQMAFPRKSRSEEHTSELQSRENL